jgi:hypothetical protein
MAAIKSLDKCKSYPVLPILFQYLKFYWAPFRNGLSWEAEIRSIFFLFSSSFQMSTIFQNLIHSEPCQSWNPPARFILQMARLEGAFGVSLAPEGVEDRVQQLERVRVLDGDGRVLDGGHVARLRIAGDKVVVDPLNLGSKEWSAGVDKVSKVRRIHRA